MANRPRKERDVVQKAGRVLLGQALLVETELEGQLVHVGGRIEGLEIKG